MTKSDQSEWSLLLKKATAAYWHPCFSNFYIDAPERMEAALAVVVQHLESISSNDPV